MSRTHTRPPRTTRRIVLGGLLAAALLELGLNSAVIGDALVDYRKAADVIEASDLDYTIIRPAWLTNNDETDYELTQRDEQFKGTEVSRKAVAAFIASVVADPSTHSRANVGVNKPGTEGDKPAWY